MPESITDPLLSELRTQAAVELREDVLPFWEESVFDAASQLTTGVVGSTSTAYTFDARGDRTKATTGTTVATYGYDQVNRLTSFARGTTTASYTYNGDGLRASKKVGSTTTKFVYDTAEGLPLVLSDGVSFYLYGPDGTPYAQITTAGVVTYLHADQLGSIRMITSSTGTSVGTATYTAYGTRTTTGTTSAFGYAGQYTDTESGLQWLRARYYDPTTGQFLTVDPLAAATGARYAYAGSDPIANSDPTGLFCVFGHNSDGSCRGSGVVNAAVGAVKEGAHLADDAVTDPFYLMYWGSLDANGAIHWTLGHAFGQAGCHVADVVAAPLLPSQAIGLGIDVAGDWFKEHVLHVPNYTVGDEGDPNAYLLGSQVGPLARHIGINWRHDFPGVHPDGHVDWRW
jgi:RHS repeat-associated protein